MNPLLPPLKPTPMKERISILFLSCGRIDVKDGAFVLIDKNGIRTHIPVGSVACLMLEPGTRVSHAAVALASRVGCLLIWVAESGVRLYASGQPGGARADRLLYQAKLALDDTARLKVVRKMYEIRFQEKPPERRSVEQLRGIEGARVRKLYQLMAKQYKVDWKRRNYDHTDWGSGDIPNRCLSSATACLYGICEAAILAAGYAPAWALSTPANPSLLFMTLLICSSSILLFRWPLKLRPESPIIRKRRYGWPVGTRFGRRKF